MSNIVRCVILFVVSVTAVGAWAQSSSPPGGQPVATPQSIEQKASLANADDPSSIRGLADEVFNLPRAFPRMPALMEGMVKDRLVQAEILYRQGKNPGVPEQDIVYAVNYVVDRLGAPSHSKTTLSQLRVLRMWMTLSEPKLMGAGVAHQDAAIGESIRPTMGPVQAANLIATLIDQKFINSDFQVTPQEWEKSSLQKVEEQIQVAQVRAAEMRSNAPRPAQGKLTSRGTYPTQKRRELEESVSSSLSSLTMKDALDLVNRTLATLGI